MDTTTDDPLAQNALVNMFLRRSTDGLQNWRGWIRLSDSVRDGNRTSITWALMKPQSEDELTQKGMNVHEQITAHEFLRILVGLTMALPSIAKAAAWSDRHFPGTECQVWSGVAAHGVNFGNETSNTSSSQTMFVSCPVSYDIGSAYGSYSTATIQWVQLDYMDMNPTVGNNGDLYCYINGVDHYRGNYFSAPFQHACSLGGGCPNSTNGTFSNGALAWSPQTNLNTGGISSISLQCQIPTQYQGVSSSIMEYQIVVNYQ